MIQTSAKKPIPPHLRELAILFDCIAVDLTQDFYNLDESVKRLASQDFLLDNRLMPLSVVDNILCIAMADPNDSGAANHLAQEHGLKAQIFVADPKELREAILRNFPD